MQDQDGAIIAEKFTLLPSSLEDKKSFLNSHLGNSLIEVIEIEHYSCKCKVRTEDGEKIVAISLPAIYIHHWEEK